MSATTEGAASRTIPGLGRIDYEEEPYRRYWFLPEGGQRRRQLRSVTTILRDCWAKPELIAWAARQGPEMDRVRERSFARGRAVHTFIETYVRDGRVLAPSHFEVDQRPYVQAAGRFLFEHDPQPEAIEELVAWPEQGYAGRLDLRARVDGRSSLLDFKTSENGRVYPEAHVQVHAYQLAAERCGAEAPERRLIVSLTAAGTYTLTEGRDSGDVWVAILQFDRWRRKLLEALDG